MKLESSFADVSANETHALVHVQVLSKSSEREKKKRKYKREANFTRDLP